MFPILNSLFLTLSTTQVLGVMVSISLSKCITSVKAKQLWAEESMASLKAAPHPPPRIQHTLMNPDFESKPEPQPISTIVSSVKPPKPINNPVNRTLKKSSMSRQQSREELIPSRQSFDVEHYHEHHHDYGYDQDPDDSEVNNNAKQIPPPDKKEYTVLPRPRTYSTGTATRRPIIKERNNQRSISATNTVLRSRKSNNNDTMHQDKNGPALTKKPLPPPKPPHISSRSKSLQNDDDPIEDVIAKSDQNKSLDAINNSGIVNASDKPHETREKIKKPEASHYQKHQHDKIKDKIEPDFEIVEPKLPPKPAKYARPEPIKRNLNDIENKEPESDYKYKIAINKNQEKVQYSTIKSTPYQKPIISEEKTMRETHANILNAEIVKAAEEMNKNRSADVNYIVSKHKNEMKQSEYDPQTVAHGKNPVAYNPKQVVSDANSSYGHKYPTYDPRTPNYSHVSGHDLKYSTIDHKPPPIQAKPVNYDHKPPPIQAKPMNYEYKPPSVQAKPVIYDYKPPSIQAKPVIYDYKPPSIQTKPINYDYKPPPVQVKPVNYDYKPEYKPVPIQAKSINYDYKPQRPESKPPRNDNQNITGSYQLQQQHFLPKYEYQRCQESYTDIRQPAIKNYQVPTKYVQQQPTYKPPPLPPTRHDLNEKPIAQCSADDYQYRSSQYTSESKCRPHPTIADLDSADRYTQDQYHASYYGTLPKSKSQSSSAHVEKSNSMHASYASEARKQPIGHARSYSTTDPVPPPRPTAPHPTRSTTNNYQAKTPSYPSYASNNSQQSYPTHNTSQYPMTNQSHSTRAGTTVAVPAGDTYASSARVSSNNASRANAKSYAYDYNYQQYIPPGYGSLANYGSQHLPPYSTNTLPSYNGGSNNIRSDKPSYYPYNAQYASHTYQPPKSSQQHSRTPAQDYPSHYTSSSHGHHATIGRSYSGHKQTSRPVHPETSFHV